MTSTISPPLGYTAPEKPQSEEEVFRTWRVPDRAATITKSAIQSYLQSFFDPNGVNRGYLTSIASPTGLQFVTSLTYDSQMKTNPNLKKVLLARFFAENKGTLPSVLIIDQGTEYTKPGINELVSAGMLSGNRYQSDYVFLLKISLSLLVATLSEEDTDTLASMVSLIVGPLANAVNGHLIRGGGQWEVRLPLIGGTIGQATGVQIEGDSKTTYWTKNIDIVCDFETQIGFTRPAYRVSFPPTAVTFNGNEEPLLPPVVRNLAPNQELLLGAPYPLMIENMLLRYSLAVSDPNVALVTAEPPYILQPRAPGRALLLFFDKNRSKEPLTPEAPVSNRLVLEVPFLVKSV